MGMHSKTEMYGASYTHLCTLLLSGTFQGLPICVTLTSQKQMQSVTLVLQRLTQILLRFVVFRGIGENSIPWSQQMKVTELLQPF